MTVAGSQRERCAQASAVERRGGCNLDPLRTLGADSLRPNIPQILKIRLVEIEIVWEGMFRRVEVIKADDLFKCYNIDCPLSSLIPYSGDITRAIFAVHFSESAGPVTVEISASEPPALPTGSDTESLRRWLTQSGFCE
jgi:hypothetical protein